MMKQCFCIKTSITKYPGLITPLAQTPQGYPKKRRKKKKNWPAHVALKYLIFAMQNSSCGSDFFIAPVNYPMGVIDGSRKYFSWSSLALVWKTPWLPMVRVCLMCRKHLRPKEKDKLWNKTILSFPSDFDELCTLECNQTPLACQVNGFFLLDLYFSVNGLLWSHSPNQVES
jgi:hypothetical protein